MTRTLLSNARIFDGTGAPISDGDVVIEDGVISASMKEVIALVLAVAAECDGCIAAHARSAVKRGASPDQVAEALGVAIMMGGGPATVFAPRAWEAYQEFLGQE